MDHELLKIEECYEADKLAEKAGIASIDLMEAAGAGVAREIRARWQKQPVVILCGPGNNGGDGFVVARHLAESGWPVRLALLGKRENLKGDAAINAERWQGNVENLSLDLIESSGLVVDGLFGAGLTRPIDGIACQIIESINERNIDCIGIDVPSGIHGDSGDVLGVAPKCALTVTFFRPKPGLSLLPGRLFAGEVATINIGIPRSVLDTIEPKTQLNHPDLWRDTLPIAELTGNKYTRGHAVIFGGDEMTGAARLSASGARRLGAGLVTICSSPEAFPIYAAGDPGLIVKPIQSDQGIRDYLEDPRRNVVLIGPGAGVSDQTKRRTLEILSAKKSTVLDADALSVFEGQSETLFDAIEAPAVLTPHEGEFTRLFPDITGGKLERTCAAAKQSGAVVLLKGGDTVIASPDGRAVITDHVSAYLATAGSGDVLAGMISGLISQGMDEFWAACAASWIHGEAGLRFGVGLIAEDIPNLLPGVMADILKQ